MKFKLLAAAIVSALVAMITVWWLAATAQKSAIENWLSERRDAGWQAEAREVAVNGFPNRLDATLRDLALANTDEGWSWSAERLAIRQVIWDPSFFVIHFPPESRIAAPGAKARLTADRMEASLKLADTATGRVERASFDARLLGAAADQGWTASAERLTHHIRTAPGAGPENAYQFRLDATRLRPPAHIRELIGITDAPRCTGLDQAFGLCEAVMIRAEEHGLTVCGRFQGVVNAASEPSAYIGQVAVCIKA